MKTSERGFSLIELLIVVAIILIIAAIAIPDFIKSKMAANQASAAQSLRVLNSSEVMYASNYGKGYSSSLNDLKAPTGGAIPSLTAAGLIDNILGSGVKSGYRFTYTPNSPDTNGYYVGYTITADPVTPGTSGGVYYYTDQSFVIRFNNTQTANSTDQPLSK
jgi:type IV pilus assembly protein PilA